VSSGRSVSFPDAVSAKTYPCAQVGPLIWRQPLEGPTVQYLTRRDSVLVVVSQTGDHINEDVLRKAVQTLTPQPPSHFSRGGY
jgi:hypothetical protein